MKALAKALFELSPAQQSAALALPHRHPATWIATWFGIGFMPRAPGSWGSLAALPFGVLIIGAGGQEALLAAIMVCCLVALWAIRAILPYGRGGDPAYIVIDEVAGLWISLLPCGLNTGNIFLAFLLFRVFDILKPGPVGWLDRKVHGAAGVLADDLAAGCAAALCILALGSLTGF